MEGLAMRPLFCLSVGLCLALVGCGRSARPVPAPVLASSPVDEGRVAGAQIGDLVVGNPVTFAKLTIFPIASLVPKNEDRFITLDEGLASGTVKIVEIGLETTNALDDPPSDEAASEAISADSLFGDLEVNQVRTVAGDVNQLLVINNADKPLYLMPGEVISGGNQDRTIGEYVVIQPSGTPVPIDVFCVEQGRWSGRTIQGTTELLGDSEFAARLSLVVSQTQAIEEIADHAQRGEFVASVGQLSKNVRLAVQDSKDQSGVWSEVDATNMRVGNDAETGNFAMAYSNPEVLSNLKAYCDAFEHLGDTNQIVGVAVSVNGRMLSSDVFESTPLFRKFWPKLLKSYALDAYAAANSGDAAEVQVNTREECVRFLKGIAEQAGETENLDEGQVLIRHESSEAVRFSYYDADAADASGVTQLDGVGMGGFGGGLGGAVHSGAFGK